MRSSEKAAGAVRVQGQVELVFPAEFEAGLGQRIIAHLGAGEALGQVRAKGGDIALVIFPVHAC